MYKDEQGNMVCDKEGNPLLLTLSDEEDRLNYSLVGPEDFDINENDYKRKIDERNPNFKDIRPFQGEWSEKS